MKTVVYRSVLKSGMGSAGVRQVKPSNSFTPYVNDFQTLNNPGSWQPVGASKISFTFHVWHKSYVLDNVKLAELSNITNNSFEWESVTF